MRQFNRFILPFAAALLLAGGAAALAQPVDVALVMAVDVSESVDESEYLLQHDGIARAFEDPILAATIAAGRRGAIEVAVLEWSDRDKQVVTVDWTRVGDAASAAAIGDALLAARALFGSAPAPADRKLVDLSGDGMANIGPPVRETRDALVADGITINGLAILASEPWLESYYDEYVIGGAGAFLLRAEDFSSFATAMHNKLLGEIAGLMPAAPPRGERRPVAQIQYVLSGAKPLKPTDE
jgi:Protein of unknown function (DUF1194)